MTIQAVRDSLKNTIAEKQSQLENYAEQAELGVYPKTLIYEGKVEVLETVIAELEKLLADLEQSYRKMGWSFDEDEYVAGGWE